ncbi:hypothetical protein ElyMa_006899900 [Elysia marginata]|uniref:Uncharacterized protein n=1 Tax=Elysia marginata TaxID=1093978 RepID=A0AAV4JIQ8_9GAST|nr:hypothetical protein ElyMa_006899900 [Elysia marginata]
MERGRMGQRRGTIVRETEGDRETDRQADRRTDRQKDRMRVTEQMSEKQRERGRKRKDPNLEIQERSDSDPVTIIALTRRCGNNRAWPGPNQSLAWVSWKQQLVCSLCLRLVQLLPATSSMQTYQNEIDEVLRGQGKRKSRESPPLVSPWPPDVSTDSVEAVASVSTLRQKPLDRPNNVQASGLDTTKRKNIDRSSERKTPSNHKELAGRDRNLSNAKSGARVESGSNKGRFKADEFEKRKAAICFGSDDGERSSLTPVVADIPRRDNSAAFEFLEDSAFADNLYATVISPLEKKRSKQSEQVSDKSPQRVVNRDHPHETSQGDSACSSTTAGAVSWHSGGGRTETQATPPDEDGRDILLESLLNHDVSNDNQPAEMSVSNCHRKRDSSQRSPLLGPNKNTLMKGSSQKQTIQSPAKTKHQKHQHHKQASSPPPPPKRTSSIKKHQTTKQAPVQNTNSPTSIEELQQRLLENRQHSKACHQETEEAKNLKQYNPAQQKRKQSEPHGKQNKDPHVPHHQQSIPILKSARQPSLTRQQPSHELGHSDNQGRSPSYQFSRNHSSYAQLSEAEKAQKERAARLMQIYEDVKNISRHTPNSSFPGEKASQLSDKTKYHTDQHHHTEHNHSDIHKKTVSHQKRPQERPQRQIAPPQNIGHASPQHKIAQNLHNHSHQQTKQGKKNESDRYYKGQRKPQEQKHHEKASPLYENVEHHKQAHFLKNSPFIPHRSPHSHKDTAQHTSRAMSDHVTNIPKQALLPRSPRRFSDSETYREVDFPQTDSGSSFSWDSQTLHDISLLGAVADVKPCPEGSFDFLVSGSYQDSDSAPCLSSSPPPIFSFSPGRRLSDTALYSSQFSDFDEMTSSMEEATIVTPPPEFMNEPEDPIPDHQVNITTPDRSSAESAVSSKGSGIPVLHARNKTSAAMRNLADAGDFKLDNRKEIRPRRKTVDSVAVARVFAHESPKSLHLNAPPASGVMEDKMSGRYHSVRGAETCQATHGVSPSLTQGSQRTPASRSPGSHAVETPETRVDYSRSSQDLDISQCSMRGGSVAESSAERTRDPVVAGSIPDHAMLPLSWEGNSL